MSQLHISTAIPGCSTQSRLFCVFEQRSHTRIMLSESYVVSSFLCLVIEVAGKLLTCNEIFMVFVML